MDFEKMESRIIQSVVDRWMNDPAKHELTMQLAKLHMLLLPRYVIGPNVFEVSYPDDLGNNMVLNHKIRVINSELDKIKTYYENQLIGYGQQTKNTES